MKALCLQVKSLASFYQQLSYCMAQYVEKDLELSLLDSLFQRYHNHGIHILERQDPRLAYDIITSMLRYWPVLKLRCCLKTYILYTSHFSPLALIELLHGVQMLFFLPATDSVGSSFPRAIALIKLHRSSLRCPSRQSKCFSSTSWRTNWASFFFHVFFHFFEVHQVGCEF